MPWAIEQCALQSPLAQQHRNKVGLQARAILKTLVARPSARIASVGCGGCRDLSMVQDYIPAGHGRFVLVDADAGALAFARERFDYLPDRWAVATLAAIRRMLAPGGRLFLSNIATGNPFRPWIEYLADRWLIERQEADMLRLLEQAGFDPALATISRDSSGLALLVDVTAN